MISFNEKKCKEKPGFAINKHKKVFIKTFGCQMNKLDTELSSGLLINSGYQIVDDINSAGVILFNTCSVRGHAEEKVYSHIGALKARKLKEPGLIIGVLGCMAQKDGKGIFNRAPYVSLVCGTRMLHKLPDFLNLISENKKQIIANDKDQFFSIPRTVNHKNRLQEYVSIMRGCDNYCSYCIVPYVRGNEISRDITSIENEVKILVKNGCKEVTLLGQNVNSYGKNLNNGENLAMLLETISSIDKLERIKFITSHPKDMSTELLKAIKNNHKVCKYLHLPAQSGSDKILQKMNRKYTSIYYRKMIDSAREIIPDISISSDFIVGFPGESDNDFEETVRLISDVRFSNCFVFKYSSRKGTAAALKLKDDIAENVKKERNNILLNLQEKISSEENKKLKGDVFDVLVEKLNSKGFNSNTINNRINLFSGNLFGRSEYNHIVVFNGDKELIGKIAKVEILDSTSLTLFGKHLLKEFSKKTISNRSSAVN